tara:strand:- start:377 stop:628 length:252 start_codon:yes stop_codon:yes gene_type:complete
MDKSDYKDLLAESYSETSKLKDTIKTIQTIVHDEPNNMQLGKKIRDYFTNKKNKDVYIYESPDGGKTVYRRRFGEADGLKEKI